MRRTLLSAAFVLIISARSIAQTAPATQPADNLLPAVADPSLTFPIRTFNLNKIDRYFDGQWQGILAGSDGKAYFGASTHSDKRGGSFLRYDPATDKLETLADDITRTCGLDPANTIPHGKLHSVVAEFDGWIYLATHIGAYWDAAYEQFTGSHLLGYEIATGKWRDFGVLRPRYSVYSALAVDPRPGKRCIYTFVTPFAERDIRTDGSHVYRIDIDTGKIHDLGLIKRGGYHACYAFFVAPDGDVWFTLREDDGSLWRLRTPDKMTGSPDDVKIDRYQDVLPAMTLGPTGEGSPLPLGYRFWTQAEPITGGARSVFSMGIYHLDMRNLPDIRGKHFWWGDEHLWIFDPAKAQANPKDAFEDRGYIGANFMAMSVASDRVYWLTDRIDPVGSKRIVPYATKNLHLFSMLAAGDDKTVTHHGKIVDPRGQSPIKIESFAVSARGNVFMTGTFRTDKDEPSSLRVWMKRGKRSEENTNRALFFATAKID